MSITVTSPVAASGSVTLADELDDQDSFRIGDQTYVFATTPDAANEIDIGADQDGSCANLVAAINGTGTPGTEYFAGTSPVTGITATYNGSGVVQLDADLPGAHGNSFEITNLVGTDVTVVDFQGGVGDVPALIDDILANNSVNSEVIRELLRLTSYKVTAALP